MNIVLPEIVAIGIYNSHIAVKNKTVTHNRKTTMFELELPLTAGGISHINDEKAPIETDMMICAKPGQLRHTRLPFTCYYVHMILPDGALSDALKNVPNFVKTTKYDHYRDLFKRMCEHYESALEHDEIMLHSLILELIHTLVKDAGRQERRDSAKHNNDAVIEKVIKYIKENLTADLSLETLSAYAGFSAIHFHNCFKSSTGKTLHEYVEEQRIKKAANMLIATNYTLTKIAYECGFSSQSYFSFAFKRRMGVTPRVYAKEVLERYGTE